MVLPLERPFAAARSALQGNMGSDLGGICSAVTIAASKYEARSSEQSLKIISSTCFSHWKGVVESSYVRSVSAVSNCLL